MFVFYFCLGATPGGTQSLLLAGSRDHLGCRDGPSARQTPTSPNPINQVVKSVKGESWEWSHFKELYEGTHSLSVSSDLLTNSNYIPRKHSAQTKKSGKSIIDLSICLSVL